MSKLDQFLPIARITEPRYWTKYESEAWFKVIRRQRVLSATWLKEELAQKASELRAEQDDWSRVVDAYRREYGLTLEQLRTAHRNRFNTYGQMP